MKEQWVTPQLILLGRGETEERVLQVQDCTGTTGDDLGGAEVVVGAS